MATIRVGISLRPDELLEIDEYRRDKRMSRSAVLARETLRSIREERARERERRYVDQPADATERAA